MASACGRILDLGAAALCALVSGCSTSPSPAATEPPGTATAPIVTTTPAITPRPSPIDPASVEIDLLGARYVPANAPVSANGQVIWTAGEHWVPEIWRFIPG